MPTFTPEVINDGADINASPHRNNYAGIAAILNGGIDQTNFAAGKIIDPTKLLQNGATARQALIWDTATGTWIPGGHMIDVVRKVTEKDVANDNNERDLLDGAGSIAANLMSTNRTVRATLIGDLLQNAGTTATLKLKFGTTIWWQATIAPTTDVDRRSWRIEFNITNLNVTNSQWADGRLRIGSAIAATVGYDGGAADAEWLDQGVASMPGVLAVDTTAVKLVEVTVQWAAASVAASWRLKNALLEVI